MTKCFAKDREYTDDNGKTSVHKCLVMKSTHWRKKECNPKDCPFYKPLGMENEVGNYKRVVKQYHYVQEEYAEETKEKVKAMPERLVEW